MPFPINFFLTHQYTIKNTFSCRKEVESGLSQKFLSCKKEKVSLSASYKGNKVKAGITLEAVYCIPLFLYASICLLWLLEFSHIRTMVRSGMQQAGKEITPLMCDCPEAAPLLVESQIVRAIGADKLNRSSIEGGSSGLHCGGSYVRGDTGILEMKVKYKVKLPIAVFGIQPIESSQSMRMKGWNGYVKDGLDERAAANLVYITPTGTVYHKDRNCSYLNPSVQSISRVDLETMRNKDGEIYRPCPFCKRLNPGQTNVYVTGYGTKYHTSLECGGLKRTILAIPLEEAGGRKPCSKCGG